MTKAWMGCALLAAMLAGCDLRYAILGFPQPAVRVAGAGPIALPYREAKGGLVLLTGRVNGKADVEFILDTGAPVTVLIDGPRTLGLALDSSRARQLGPAGNPAAPIGDIQEGFEVAFDRVTLSKLAAVVVPAKTMPCRERFDEIGFGGVIGADLFRRFVVEIDPAAKRVRLHDPSGWQPPADSASLTLAFRFGHPFVETTVTTPGDAAIPLRMNVDTGMNRGLTLAAGSHPAIAMPADGIPRRSCYVGGTRDEREGTGIVEVAFGAMRVPVDKVVYSASPNVIDGEATSTMGAGFFAGRRVFIDYPGRRLLLAP